MLIDFKKSSDIVTLFCHIIIKTATATCADVSPVAKKAVYCCEE